MVNKPHWVDYAMLALATISAAMTFVALVAAVRPAQSQHSDIPASENSKPIDHP